MKALADSTRFRIMEMIKDTPLLVTAYRKGKKTYYYSNKIELEKAFAWLEDLTKTFD